MRCRFVFSFALAAAVAGTAHAAQPTPLFAATDWQRFASPDGTVSALFPCTKAEASTRSENGGFAIECRKQGLLFVLSSGLSSNEGAVVSYETFLANAVRDLPAEEIKQFKIAERRAFTIVCPEKEGVACLEVVDLLPGKPLLVGAVEESLDPAQRAPGLEAGRKFYGSLEIRDK